MSRWTSKRGERHLAQKPTLHPLRFGRVWLVVQHRILNLRSVGSANYHKLSQQLLRGRSKSKLRSSNEAQKGPYGLQAKTWPKVTQKTNTKLTHRHTTLKPAP
ncbi:O-acetylhomoserine lyase [Pseudozyma hubeiensis SY62]|uniref:O-acetylhomoserine lyase n=1 Tax=Pseudozyma hubeiensis (strain SY62) TaxID=1305764 RepID=R9P7X4_PSEHS|nr:O-acetylhomoserine lyase [Pseudozyma hubeiensis SY62]GAC97503.1 O-acetylhomoserine lyase [Pseudozyma hubeiensis SY62]